MAENTVNALRDTINVELGLQYCGEMEDLLVEMLEEYVASDKRETLGQLLAAGSLADYRIQVHALKSTSLMIGAEAVSAKAKELELAANDGNVDFLNANHADTMAMYGELLDKIKAAL